MVERWERGSKVVLKHNPSFWDPRYPYLDEVELQVSTDDTNRMFNFQGYTVDMATNVPFNQFDPLQNDPTIGIQVNSIMRVDSISMNHTRPSFGYADGMTLSGLILPRYV